MGLLQVNEGGTTNWGVVKGGEVRRTYNPRPKKLKPKTPKP